MGPAGGDQGWICTLMPICLRSYWTICARARASGAGLRTYITAVPFRVCPASKSARPRQVGPGERIDVSVHESRRAVRQELIGSPPCKGAECGNERVPVDRVAHGTTELRVVREQGPGRVQGETEGLVPGANEEPRLVHAVLGRDRPGRSRRDDPVVGVAALNLERDRVALDLEHPVDLGRVARDACLRSAGCA